MSVPPNVFSVDQKYILISELKSAHLTSSGDNKVKSLIRQSSKDETKSLRPNYAWLRSRHLSVAEDNSFYKYEHTVSKLTPESCAAIAVKLDTLTDGANIPPENIVKVFEKLLEEQENIQLLQLADKRGKKVQAQIGRRRATIAFISY